MSILKQILNRFKHNKHAPKWMPTPETYTRWYLIGNYSHHCDSFATFARKDYATGELFFMTKKVSADDHGKTLSRIDTQSAWDQLMADKGDAGSDLGLRMSVTRDYPCTFCVHNTYDAPKDICKNCIDPITGVKRNHKMSKSTREQFDNMERINSFLKG